MGTKSFQRERRFLCGTSKNAANYQEVEIYPMNGTEQSRTLDQELARAADLRRSSKAQQNQNAKNARRLFRQLVNTNFTEEDTHTTQTYAPEYRPETEEQAWADFRNFYRHIKEKCRARGLPKPECLAVMEWAEENPDTGQKAVAPHFHTILRCDLTRPGKLYAEISKEKAQIFPKPRNQKPDNTAPGGREMDAPPSAKNLHRRAAVRPGILGEKIPRLGLERSQRKL